MSEHYWFDGCVPAHRDDDATVANTTAWWDLHYPLDPTGRPLTCRWLSIDAMGACVLPPGHRDLHHTHRDSNTCSRCVRHACSPTL